MPSVKKSTWYLPRITSRIGLDDLGNAPRIFKRLSKNSVPLTSLAFTTFLMLVGVLLLFIIPAVMTDFTIVSTVSAILASYIAYRKTRPDLHAQSRYKMPGGLPVAWLSLAFLTFVLCLPACPAT